MRNYSAYGVSLGVHAVILVAMAMIKMTLLDAQPEIAVETVFDEERVQEEFTRELEMDTEVATEINTVSGGMVSTTATAATAPSVSQQKIETSESLKEPDIRVNPGPITVPGDDAIGDELGESEVAGETARVVDGYGAALGELTKEIVRLMRQQKVLVVWLFDESDSMKDDRKEIAANFHKVTEELKMVQRKDSEFKKGKEILLTAVLGFGEKIHPLTPKPTADLSEIQAAIKKVPLDESGLENMCQAIHKSITEYHQQALKQRRKLVVVVVTDESGDDFMQVEEAITVAKRANSPIYILGRESVFGYPFARIRWIDPVFHLPHWLTINRGPETAFVECLQWDGLHGRWDAFSAGFGPYEQVRLARESGGIFFVLPGEEEDLAGAGAHEKRQFDFLDMKQYQPLLLSRRDYEQAVVNSKFRKTIWDVIVMFNPNNTERLPRHDPNLNIRELHYSIKINEFQAQASKEVLKAARAMSLLNQAMPMLEKIRPLRAREASQRWRANYDLALAQLLAYRVRLFQYLLAMDEHANTNPKPTKKKSNEWNVGRRPKMIVPDDAQFERVKKAFGVKSSKEEYLKVLKQQELKSRELYQFVTTEHPRTPWARRAQWELDHGFGMYFYDYFYDPRYHQLKIKFPKQ